MYQNIIYHGEARKRLLSGADLLADAVRYTLGPLGRSAAVQRRGAPVLITSDGAAIAKEIVLEDPFENMGAQALKQAASKTREAVGDGAATAVLLAWSILREGVKAVAAGAEPMALRRGIQAAAQTAEDAIRAAARRVDTKEELVRAVGVSAKDAGIGAIIAEAIGGVGRDGTVLIRESPDFADRVVVKDGLRLERGYLSPALIADQEKMEEELTEPYILVTDMEITRQQELLPLLEQVAEEGGPLLIIAEKLEGEALGLLAANKKQGRLNVIAVHPPAYGDGRAAQMEDIAVFTGGTFLTKRMGHSLRDVTTDMLGLAASVKVDRQDTVIVGGYGEEEALAGRVRYIRMLLEKSEYAFDRERLRERLAKLTGGVAVIEVGADTEAAREEKKLQMEAALHAARAAAAGGIVPGGGAAFIDAVPAVKRRMEDLSGDERTGAAILQKALEAPLRQIAENAGWDGSAVAARVLEAPAGTGFDVLRGAYADMLEAGIADPAPVVCLALRSAASAAALLLTTGAASAAHPAAK